MTELAGNWLHTPLSGFCRRILLTLHVDGRFTCRMVYTDPAWTVKHYGRYRALDDLLQFSLEYGTVDEGSGPDRKFTNAEFIDTERSYLPSYRWNLDGDVLMMNTEGTDRETVFIYRRLETAAHQDM